jgi:hypothetical protein
MMSGPYGFTSTSFRVNRALASSFGTERKPHSVQALIALALVRQLSAELQARGYKVSKPGVAKNAAIASFRCTLPLLKVDIFISAADSDGDWLECKLEPLGWRRMWKSPAYQEIWQAWEQLRIVIDHHLSKALQIESLCWRRPKPYKETG